MPDYKQLYIDLLKRSDEDICEKCQNYHECDGEKCQHYCKGDTAYDEDGTAMRFNWTCKDFEYGTCLALENTPCNGCFDNGCSGFVLKEDKQ